MCLYSPPPFILLFSSSLLSPQSLKKKSQVWSFFCHKLAGSLSLLQRMVMELMLLSGADIQWSVPIVGHVRSRCIANQPLHWPAYFFFLMVKGFVKL